MASQATKETYILALSPDNREFTLEKVPDMNIARISHGLVLDSSRRLVYAIGGYDCSNCLNSCEGYALDRGQWIQMANLNVERSKPTVFMYKNELYAFGGLSLNPNITACLAEKYDFDGNQWKPIAF